MGARRGESRRGGGRRDARAAPGKVPGVTEAALDGLDVLWHQVECGSYTADLPLWRELAGEAKGPLLDLGAGTGRVALDLAAHGHEVTAVDTQPGLLDELAGRARARGLAVEVLTADVRSLALRREYALAVAPMQLVQLLVGPAGRAALLAGVRRSLRPGGRFAAALADPHDAIAPEDALPPLPDVLEHDRWVLTSQPLDVRAEQERVAVDRLRQLVSPSGELSEELSTVLLDVVSAEQFEREAGAAGLRPAGRRAVPETPDHIGSTVVIVERARAARPVTATGRRLPSQDAGPDAPRS
jgi:SAM-dependent methyltransferase